MIFATIESAVLFGETRSGAFTLSDAELADELVRAYLAYLGVDPTGPTPRSNP